MKKTQYGAAVNRPRVGILAMVEYMRNLRGCEFEVITETKKVREQHEK